MLILTPSEKAQALDMADRMAEALEDLEAEQPVRIDIVACALGLVLVSLFEAARDRDGLPIEHLVDAFVQNLRRITSTTVQ